MTRFISRLAICSSLVLASGSLATAQTTPAAPTATPGTPVTQPESKAPAKLATKLEVGANAPVLAIEKWLKGTPVTTFTKDHVYALVFWSPSSQSSQRYLPRLTELQMELKDKNVHIVGIAGRGGGAALDKAEKLLADKGAAVDFAIAWDDSSKANDEYFKAADAGRVPWVFIVDQQGKLAFHGDPADHDLGLVLDKIVAGKWDIKNGPDEIEQMEEEATAVADAIMEKALTDASGAWKDFQAFQTKYPRIARFQSALKAELLIKNNDPEAYKFAATVVDEQVVARNYIALNTIAWAIVDPKAPTKSRDIELAMKAATEANRLSKEKNSAILDTLARVYWLKNEKPKALELQKKAVELAEDEDLKTELEANLKEYQSEGKR